tara:strand:+ start:100 stop:291 length:192 start_codon:yes stop_codon:yes gene_type:complete
MVMKIYNLEVGDFVRHRKTKDIGIVLAYKQPTSVRIRWTTDYQNIWRRHGITQWMHPADVKQM